MTIEVRSLGIPDVKIITPRRFADSRGWFVESWTRTKLEALGLDIDFCQENQSFSSDKGTIRGLHFQTPPHAQDKLVRVLRGRIWDVAVDIRKSSPTFGQWVAEEISAEAGNQILVPKGFAHGFCTLEPETEVAYLVSDVYAPETDACILWSDPALGIDWPTTQPHLSDKDSRAACLVDISAPLFE